MSMSMNRRRFHRGAAAALGAPGLAAACAPTSPPAAGPGQPTPSRTFRIAYLTLGWAGIELIHQLGFLEQRGWSITWQAVDSISGVVNAFAAGQLDLIDMSAVIAAQMYEQGVKPAVFGLGVGALGAVLVARDSTIRAVPDLRGRTVAGIPGSTTNQALNASIRRIYGFDVFTDTRFVPGAAPPDVANLFAKGDVEAALIWEPTTTQLTQSGAGTILATQQQLWEEASGARGTEVHVVYVATPQVAQQFPALLRDVNTAQAQVAERWARGDAQAVEGMMKVTRLPREVVQEALSRTTPLSGLPEDAMEAILQQLHFNRRYGTILQSDVWTQDPAKARRELFVKVS
ncbi:MAG TPA: PhnD/SsuA/transferrin family substrate-binding protein [Chloroflexota bacterium]|nr:PhnD/SsuA/transferrin family substrate-binding protein [Chloroflexota bacterium]